MADSEWESIRKKTRNRIRYGIGIGIPVLILAGFLFYNNRDLFNSSVQSDETVERADTAEMKSLPASAAVHDEDSNKSVSFESNDSVVKNTDNVTMSVASEIKKTENYKTVAASPDSKLKVIEVPKTVALSGTSLELSSIRCRTADQNGLVLDLSVELLSAKDAIEKKILIMRDELRVLIQNTVRSKEVNTLSREQLKAEIIESVNKYIGKEVFNNLKFTEFKVEKVK